MYCSDTANKVNEAIRKASLKMFGTESKYFDQKQAAQDMICAATRNDQKQAETGGQQDMICAATRNEKMTYAELVKSGVISTADYKAELRKRRRQSLARREQHRRTPFNLSSVLFFEDSVDHKNFRRKLSDLNNGRFHIEVETELCKTQTYQVHYHMLVRTTCSQQEFDQYITDCISHRKGIKPMTRFNLKTETIDNDLAERLFIYNSKAMPEYLNQVIPQEAGKRTRFTIGQPFSKPVRKLASSEYKVHKMSCNAGLLEDHHQVYTIDDQLDYLEESGFFKKTS